MENFLSITLTDEELRLLERAAALEKGRPVERYILQAAIGRAKEDLASRPSEAVVQRQRALIQAYKQAMRFDKIPSMQCGRVARACMALAKDGRDPRDLERVVQWMRQVDTRYRQGQAIPVEEIAYQWPAWLAVQQPVTPELTTPSRRAAPDSAPDSAVMSPQSAFGAFADWDEL